MGDEHKKRGRKSKGDRRSGSFRWTDEGFALLAKAADMDRRSVNDHLIYLCEKDLKEKGLLSEKPTDPTSRS